MKNQFKNLKIQKIIESEEVVFSPLEAELAEKFGVSPEQLREMIMESDEINELISKLQSTKEV